jgi:hypothetical protein
MLKTNGIGGLGLGRSTIVKKGVESIGIKVRPHVIAKRRDFQTKTDAKTTQSAGDQRAARKGGGWRIEVGLLGRRVVPAAWSPGERA